MAVRIQIRRGTAAEWAAANPVLMEGELGVELDTGKWKTGDGVRAWSDLDYVYDAGAVDALQSDLVAHKDAAAPHSGHATTTALSSHLSNLANPHAVTAEQAGAAPASDNAGFHNSIYRGKSLGTSVTAEQYANIADGTFRDMYIGDYWTINGVQYIIAAFNYYHNTGDTALTQNHVTLVPGGTLYTHEMNDSDTTEGGYVGSKMYTEGLAQAKSMINYAFSGHVVTHRRYLSNAVSDGQASAGAWFDSNVELMSEVMVYGSMVNGSYGISGLFDTGADKSQLPLFALRPDLIGIRTAWWLRNVSSASYFARVDNDGVAGRYGASRTHGVRPAFSIS